MDAVAYFVVQVSGNVEAGPLQEIDRKLHDCQMRPRVGSLLIPWFFLQSFHRPSIGFQDGIRCQMQGMFGRQDQPITDNAVSGNEFVGHGLFQCHECLDHAIAQKGLSFVQTNVVHMSAFHEGHNLCFRVVQQWNHVKLDGVHSLLLVLADQRRLFQFSTEVVSTDIVENPNHIIIIIIIERAVLYSSFRGCIITFQRSHGTMRP
eukprot:15076665-Ditylum_brightwellii.AAC.1